MIVPSFEMIFILFLLNIAKHKKETQNEIANEVAYKSLDTQDS